MDIIMGLFERAIFVLIVIRLRPSINSGLWLTSRKYTHHIRLGMRWVALLAMGQVSGEGRPDEYRDNAAHLGNLTAIAVVYISRFIIGTGLFRGF